MAKTKSDTLYVVTVFKSHSYDETPPVYASNRAPEGSYASFVGYDKEAVTKRAVAFGEQWAKEKSTTRSGLRGPYQYFVSEVTEEAVLPTVFRFEKF